MTVGDPDIPNPAFTEPPPLRPYGPPVDQNDLTKVTVWLVPTAVTAMNTAAARHRDSRTDTINRALHWYDHSTRRNWTSWIRSLALVAGVILPVRWLWETVVPDWTWDALITVPAGIAMAVIVLRWLDWRPR